uniref:Uncharacterized protein n=1 Tax=Prymnesium polylepis TaxID=72548 RepID=A0A7S4MY85_9EUKA
MRSKLLTVSACLALIQLRGSLVYTRTGDYRVLSNMLCLWLLPFTAAFTVILAARRFSGRTARMRSHSGSLMDRLECARFLDIVEQARDSFQATAGVASAGDDTVIEDDRSVATSVIGWSEATSDDFPTESLSQAEVAAMAAKAPGVPSVVIEGMARRQQIDGSHRRMIQHHSGHIWSLMRLLFIGNRDAASFLSHIPLDVVQHLSLVLLRAMLARMKPTTANSPIAPWTRRASMLR